MPRIREPDRAAPPPVMSKKQRQFRLADPIGALIAELTAETTPARFVKHQPLGLFV